LVGIAHDPNRSFSKYVSGRTFPHQSTSTLVSRDRASTSTPGSCDTASTSSSTLATRPLHQHSATATLETLSLHQNSAATTLPLHQHSSVVTVPRAGSSSASTTSTMMLGCRSAIQRAMLSSSSPTLQGHIHGSSRARICGKDVSNRQPRKGPGVHVCVVYTVRTSNGFT
jgi:hypothetical protein